MARLLSKFIRNFQPKLRWVFWPWYEHANLLVSWTHANRILKQKPIKNHWAKFQRKDPKLLTKRLWYFEVLLSCVWGCLKRMTMSWMLFLLVSMQTTQTRLILTRAVMLARRSMPDSILLSSPTDDSVPLLPARKY